MICKVCRDTMKNRRTDVEFFYQEKLVVVKNIEHLECDNCGERVYSSDATSKIMRKIKNNKVEKYIKVPIYS